MVPGRPGGEPLHGGLRAQLEPELGGSLDRVRVHTGEGAAAANTALGARAFTYREDVFLARGESATDARLMAHELTHVLQQRSSGQPAVQMKRGDDPSSDPAEQAADAAADRVAGSSRSLIVEDRATPGPGAMTRSAFLARLHDASVGAANEALGPTWSAAGCPYVERWFSRHAATPAPTLDRMARRYSRLEQPDSAADFLAPIAARIRDAVARWRQGTDVTTEFVEAGLNESEAAQASQAARDALRQGSLVADAGQPATGAGAGPGAAPGGAPGGPPAPAVQAKLAPGQTAFNPGDPAAVAARLGDGEPFGGVAAARMSEAYGESFGDVRLHTDPAAQQMTSGMGALAVTVGSHIAFSPGAYRPETPEGDALLAHELAHVLQQRGAAAPSGHPQAKEDGERVATDAHEADADTAAAGVMAHLYGKRPGTTRPSLAGRLRRAVGKLSAQAGARLNSSFAVARCSANDRPSPTGIHYDRGAHPDSNPTPGTWGGSEAATQDEAATHDEILADLTAMNAGGVFVFYGHANDHAVQGSDDTRATGGTTGAQMARAVGRDSNPPTVVVLGGCETAPMIQQLNDAGVPIVVGYDAQANSALQATAVDRMMTMLQAGRTFDEARTASDAILARQASLLIPSMPATTQIGYRQGYDGSMTLSSARAQHRTEVGSP